MPDPNDAQVRRIQEADTVLVTYCQLILESRSITQRVELLDSLEDAIDALRKATE
jgi:hypothetical protein